ncbi:MAG: hypothetical protein JO002_15990, partial [Burkholderiaceae bacterium]|nr:hypothetical protein [Burkholderiaceae bacterium]
VNSEQAVPALSAMPHSLWLGLSPVELLCAIGLVLPAFYKPLAMLAPAAAVCIAAEMLLFAGVYFGSGATQGGQLMYWMTAALLCAFVAVGRISLSPLQSV